MNQVWAPSRLLVLAVVGALLLVLVDWFIATRQPWLGVEFKPNTESSGLVVVHVDPRSPNSKTLSLGDVVVALSDGEREEKFGPNTLQEGGVNLPSYAAYNRFLDHHRALWGILNHQQFSFVLADGRHVAGHTHGRRPGTSLPWQFWFLVLVGITAFLIGAAIWAFRRERIAARLVLIGSAGFFPATLLTAFVSARELTLSPWWLKVGTDGDSLGAEIITYSIIALLWHYPVPLGRFPMASLCGLLVALIWANETFQIFEWPLHAYVLHYLFAFTAMAVIAILQWRKSRHQALSRASLQWFLLTLILGSGVVTILFFGPVVFDGKPIVPAVVAYAMAPLMYLGLAFGIARYRLFDLERWWLEVWLWLAGGLLVIAIDMVLIAVFEFTDLLALGFALVLAGWVYLPLRQWLFLRVLRPSRLRLDDHFPLLIDTLFREGPTGSFAERWRVLIQHVFAPMELIAQPQPSVQAALAESGLALRVPAYEDSGTFELRYREQGRRLFTPRDVLLADSLLALTRRTATAWQEREEGVRAERHRIMRDLHDDVAARLLALLHHVMEPAQQTRARDALGALRQVIYALDDQKPMALADLLIDLQAQLRARARLHGIEVDWQEPETLPTVEFGTREQINLQRVLTEAASNAIRHGAPTRFTVRLWVEEGRLHLHFCNDGAILRMEDWIAGKGINSIRNRMMELNGEVRWTVTATAPDGNNQQCCLALDVPLPAVKDK